MIYFDKYIQDTGFITKDSNGLDGLLRYLLTHTIHTASLKFSDDHTSINAPFPDLVRGLSHSKLKQACGGGEKRTQQICNLEIESPEGVVHVEYLSRGVTSRCRGTRQMTLLYRKLVSKPPTPPPDSHSEQNENFGMKWQFNINL